MLFDKFQCWPVTWAVSSKPPRVDICEKHWWHFLFRLHRAARLVSCRAAVRCFQLSPRVVPHLREEAVQGVVHQRRPGAGHGPPGQALAGQRQQRRQRLPPQAAVSPLHHQPRQLAHLRHRGRQLPGPRPGAAPAPAHLQLLHHQPRQLAHVGRGERRQGARPGRRR